MANFLKSLFVKGIEIDPDGATSAQVLSYNGTKFVPVTNSATATTDASALTSGTLNNARLPAAATNITSVGTLGSLAVTGGVTAATFTGALTGNASTATNVAYTGLTGTVTTWNQNTTGNAATVTTNANLTGGVTSVGNAATVVTNANLTGGVTSVGNAATVVTNANLTGDVTSVGNATTIGANKVTRSMLAATEQMPVGTVLTWGGSSASPPSGFLTCDGTTVSRTTYAALYAVIGDRYGAGDGSTTFTLPNFASGLLPFSTTTLNASPGTGTRQTQTVSTANTASSGHSHTLNGVVTPSPAVNSGSVQSSGHSHTLNSVTTPSPAVNSGNASLDHSHSLSTNSSIGDASVGHTHAQNSVFTGGTLFVGNGTMSHSHTYFKGNSGANAQTTATDPTGHYHQTVATDTGGQSITHAHTLTGNTGAMSQSHAHDLAHTHAAATIASSNADTTHAHDLAHTHAAPTIASSNADTTHLHTVSGTYVVYIIKT